MHCNLKAARRRALVLHFKYETHNAAATLPQPLLDSTTQLSVYDTNIFAIGGHLLCDPDL